MGNSNIEWTESVWNPVTGCTNISEGCLNCYAEPMANRLKAMGNIGYKDGFKVTCHKDRLAQPIKWKKPRTIFVCSMGDLFHEDVPDKFIRQVFNIMTYAKHHTFLVLTKRAERMHDFLIKNSFGKLDLSHIWLGVSAENQEQADKRIPLLLQTPAAKRFVSIEPMLGAIDLTSYISLTDENGTQEFFNKNGWGYDEWSGGFHDGSGDSLQSGLDWIILGGESGPGARPMHPDWPRLVKDQCKTAGVPFFFKQWGEYISYKDAYNKLGESYLYNNFLKPRSSAWKGKGSPERVRFFNKVTGKLVEDMIKGRETPTDLMMLKVGKKKAGALLDGKEYKEIIK